MIYVVETCKFLLLDACEVELEHAGDSGDTNIVGLWTRCRSTVICQSQRALAVHRTFVTEPGKGAMANLQAREVVPRPVANFSDIAPDT